MSLPFYVLPLGQDHLVVDGVHDDTEHNQQCHRYNSNHTSLQHWKRKVIQFVILSGGDYFCIEFYVYFGSRYTYTDTITISNTNTYTNNYDYIYTKLKKPAGLLAKHSEIPQEHYG